MKKIIGIICCILLLASATAYATVYEVPAPVIVPDGSCGVWQVRSIGASSVLYEGKGKSQEIIDADFSALFRDYGSGKLIMDHSGSDTGTGKWKVEDMHVGDTAWLITDTDTTEYECYMITEAVNNGYAYILDGTALYPHHSSDVLCVSCKAGTEHGVYLAFFRYVGVWG